MRNVNDAFTKNSFVSKVMGWIPDDPLTQSQYMYYLTWIVFLGLLGYAISTWYMFATTLQLRLLFSGLFMTAISLLSIFGLKQTRTTYNAMRMMRAMPKKEMTVEKMMEEFK